MSRLLPVLVVGALLPLAAGAQTYDVETLQSSGPSERRIDLVLLGDGYRATEQQKMHDDAVALVNNLFGLTPFKEYRSLFNVRVIHAISVDNGADNGSYGATRNTALGAAYNCNNIDRLLCVDMDVVKIVAAQHTPAYDQLVVIVNDPKYGGSGGEVAAVSLATSAGEILRHELGHSLARLADEYSDPYPGYPACTGNGQSDCPEANATVKNTRATVKWKDWIESTTSVPTTSTGSAQAIGAYEGCRYKTTGVYRPKDGTCLMKVLGQPYCSVCAEAMVRTFYNLASPVDTFSPSRSQTDVTTCGPVTFSVTTPMPGTFSFLWTVDGTPRSGDNRLTLAASELTQGQHTVSVTVSDTTALVRSDPQ
ncbi:MAG TPA: M64 family metallopeptidase, partial [Myxococcaceae bacterium]|nr:M64 family metallopeptidase [Myxococcaceae bacterium]